jgi:hypothetical protein
MLGTPKTCDIIEILLKMALNTINPNPSENIYAV